MVKSPELVVENLEVVRKVVENWVVENLAGENLAEENLAEEKEAENLVVVVEIVGLRLQERLQIPIQVGRLQMAKVLNFLDYHRYSMVEEEEEIHCSMRYSSSLYLTTTFSLIYLKYLSISKIFILISKSKLKSKSK